MQNTFEGQYAVVTGGSRGLGAAVTRHLQNAGCKVAVLARTQTHGIGDLAIECDIASEESQLAAFSEINRTFGRIDYAFINAGVSTLTSLIDLDMAEWDRVTGINLRGAAISLRECGKLIKLSGKGGSIVTCCSLSSYMPEKYLSPYNASKSALANLTKTAAREWGEWNIRVNGIAPGLTQTDLINGTESIAGYYDAIKQRTPFQHRLGTADDIADAVLKLMSMQWVTGHILIADGGLSLQTPTDPEEFF
jgi:NAD(P)-dependent dehydrogenase (short-subunit alcohol dehydrogenase family)